MPNNPDDDPNELYPCPLCFAVPGQACILGCRAAKWRSRLGEVSPEEAMRLIEAFRREEQAVTRQDPDE